MISALAWTTLVLASSAAGAVFRVDDSVAYGNTYRYGIQYGPEWTHWKSSDPRDGHHMQTHTYTHLPGSRAMFSFAGTGVSYIADTTPRSGTILVAIDGNQYKPIQASSTNVTYRQTLFTVSGLAPGDHQIVIGSPTNNASQPGVVALDYFSITTADELDYVPFTIGPGIRGLPANASIVDDGDATIKYSDDSWQPYDFLASGSAPLLYNGTQRSSNVPGSSLSFTFHGTGVWYFSDDSRGNANVSISIDGHESEVVSTSTGVTSISQRMFWSRKGLTDGEHVVTITHVGKQGEYANLDFFAYIPSLTTSAHASAGRLSVTTIVASVVGAVVGLGLLFAGLIFAVRRRRRLAPKGPVVDEKHAPEDAVHHITLTKVTSRDSEATFDENKQGGTNDLV